MDGEALLRAVRKLLQESSSGTFMDDRTTYGYIFDAVIAFNRGTHFLTSSQSISVTQGVTEYKLNPDYLGFADEDSSGRPFIKFTVNSTDYFIFIGNRATSVIGNNTSQSTVPGSFYIKDASAFSNITGTATSTNARSNGESILVDTGTSLSNVAVGDIIHNTTDGSSGIVIALTSSTTIVCALFDGTSNQFTSGDAYIITSQARYSIVIDPPPSQSATIAFNYVQRPAPVYSPYRSYRLPSDHIQTLAGYAAARYKYQDRDPAQAQYLMAQFDMQMKKAASEMRQTMPERQRFRVDLMVGGNTRSNPRSRRGR